MKRTLSVIALGGLLLTGCGGGTTDVERSPVDSMSPMISTPIVSTEGGEPPTSVIEPPSTTVTDTTPIPSGTDEPTQDPGITPNPLEPAPTTEGSVTTPAAAGGAWTSLEVTVTTAAQAEQLTQTPPDFRAFVATLVDAAKQSGCDSEFTILAFHADGYAAGQESSPACGGAQNIWGKVGGQWTTLMAMQSVAECSLMEDNSVPKGLPDIPCLDAKGDVTDW